MKRTTDLEVKPKAQPKTEAEAIEALTAAGLRVRDAGPGMAACLKFEASRLAPVVKAKLLRAWRVSRHLVGIAHANSSGQLSRKRAAEIVKGALG